MKRLLLSLFLVLTIVSCNKEETSALIVGDNSNVIVTPVDPTDEQLNSPINKNKVDVNGDGVYDLNFTFTSSGTNGSGYYSDSYLSCLHGNIELYGYSSNDTIFHYLDTTIYDYGTIHITYYDITSCSRSGITDSIVSVANNQFHLNQLQKNDLIPKSGSFLTTSIKLTDNAIYNPYVSASSNDTLRFWQKKRTLSCNEMGTETKYMGFRIKKKSKKKYEYGWLKFNLGDGVVAIIESAIEK